MLASDKQKTRRPKPIRYQRTLGIAISDDLYHWISESADARNTSMAEIVRAILERARRSERR